MQTILPLALHHLMQSGQESPYQLPPHFLALMMLSLLSPHPFFWGDEILDQGAGMRCNAMSMDSFTTGAIANLAFSLEGLTYTRTDASAGITPTFDGNEPPIVLSAVVATNGLCRDVNEVTLTTELAQAFLTSVKDLNGRISSRFTQRTNSGSFNPYLDDSDLTFFTQFQEDTLFEMIITLGIPVAGTPGELVPGSVVGIFLPNVLLTADSIGDQDSLLTEALEFSANAGPDGTEGDIFISFS